MSDAISAAVQALARARRERGRAEVPAIGTSAEAYAIQDGVAETLGWCGDAAPRHWKSGAPSRSAVAAHAALPDAGVWRSGTRVPANALGMRVVEAEIALRLACDVDAARAAQLEAARAASPGPLHAAALVDAMCVSIELVDSRWDSGLDAPPLARLADLQSHGALVLGEWVEFVPRDWSAQTGSVSIGAAPAIAMRGSHPLGDPTWGLVAWLRHATARHGTLSAGSVVTTGAWCGMQTARAGDTVTVRFDGIGAATVVLD